MVDPLAQADITFEALVLSGDIFADFSPFAAINDQGNVAFLSLTPAGNKLAGVFTTNGHTTTPVATQADLVNLSSGQTATSFVNWVALNNANQVGFGIRTVSPEPYAPTVTDIWFAAQAGAIVPLASNRYDSGTELRTLLDITWGENVTPISTYRRLPRLGGEKGVVKAGETTVATLEMPQFLSGPVAANEAGQIAYGVGSADLSRYSPGIYRSGYQTMPFVALDNPAYSLDMASNGLIGYSAATVVGVIGDDGQPTILADDTGLYDRFSTIAVNSNGTAVFLATQDDGTQGLFFGEDPLKHKLIQVGDQLNGFSIESLGLSEDGLNEVGNLAFYARLANGQSGIFIANLEGEKDSPVFMPPSKSNSIMAPLSLEQTPLLASDRVVFADRLMATFNPIDGTPGKDFLVGTNADDEIKAYDGNDFVLAEAGNDLIFGGDGNDALLGKAGNDTILGEAGDDQLDGGDGDDRLEGGSGDDTLKGGAGADTLIGGIGRDTFQVGDYGASDSLAGSDTDTVEDFSMAEGDVFNLNPIAAMAVYNGDISAVDELKQYVYFAEAGGGSAHLVVDLPQQSRQIVALVSGVSATALTDAADTSDLVQFSAL